MQATIHSLVEQFFQKLQVQLEQITVSLENEKDVFIHIQSTESNLLIGMHGKNREMIEHLLGRMIEKEIGSFMHIQLEVNDYLKSKEEKLIRFLESKIELIQYSGNPINIEHLSSYERKKAHHYIAEKSIDGLKTHSEGEGSDRKLILTYVGPKKNSNLATGESVGNLDISDEGVGI